MQKKFFEIDPRTTNVRLDHKDLLIMTNNFAYWSSVQIIQKLT